MKLFVSDLDKTLLNTDHLISAENMEALEELSDMGYELCIASGRAYNDILNKMKKFRKNIVIIALNGAQVFDSNGELIFSNPLKNKENLNTIIEYCEKEKLIYHLYCKNTVYSRLYPTMMKQLYCLSSSKFSDIDRIINSMQIYYNVFYSNNIISDVQMAEDIINKEDIFKLEIFSEKKSILDNISAMLTEDLTYSSSTPRNIEITNKGINKGVALLQLCDYLNIKLSNIVAIGDNFNDYEMLKIAGKSIAMENAEEKIKDICDYVTLNSDNSGVYYAIKKYLKKER